MLSKKLHLSLLLLTLAIYPAVARAAQTTLSVPLEDGWLSTSELRDPLAVKLRVPPVLFGSIGGSDVGVNLRGVEGWVWVHAVNHALGSGFHLAVTDTALTVDFDAEKLPGDWNGSCDALRRFMQTMAPEASARQERQFGLHLPRVIDADRPLVILIHGLDGDCGTCSDLAGLMKADGYQTAMFAYPAEQPLEESAELLAQHMRALHDVFPDLRIELVTESMGGLIARRYVEGAEYAGGVDRLILIAPPNEGSTWTAGAFFMKVAVNTFKWRHNPDWSPAWMITEGLCQAAGDLRPQSAFLRALNSEPRRAGVRYTIIAGDRPIVDRFESNVLGCVDRAIGCEIGGVWGVRQLKHAIEWEDSRLQAPGESDGPVTVASARLIGVDDFVRLHADHISLYQAVNGQPPVAYPVIRERLEN